MSSTAHTIFCHINAVSQIKKKPTSHEQVSPRQQIKQYKNLSRMSQTSVTLFSSRNVLLVSHRFINIFLCDSIYTLPMEQCFPMDCEAWPDKVSCTVMVCGLFCTGSAQTNHYQAKRKIQIVVLQYGGQFLPGSYLPIQSTVVVVAVHHQ